MWVEGGVDVLACLLFCKRLCVNVLAHWVEWVE